MSQGRGSFVRTLLILAVFMGALYVLVKPLPWDEAGLNVNTLFLRTTAAGIGLSVLAYLVTPYFMRFSRAQYEVNAKGISMNGRFYSWRKICDCEPPSLNVPMEGVLSLRFRAKSSESPVPLIFDAAEQDIAGAVYQYIEDHIPQQNRQWVQKPRLVLTKGQHALMTALSLTTAVAVIAARPWVSQLPKDAAAIAFILLLYAGPGTWGIFVLFGKKMFTHRNWFGWMLSYNMMTFCILVLSAFFITILRLRSL